MIGHLDGAALHLWDDDLQIGALLLFVVKFDTIPKKNTVVIGCVLLLYAAYRGFKLYKDKKSAKENINTNVEQ